MNYYISDLHINHKNVLKFDSRPFDSVEQMETAIVENWNGVVQNDDTVYILGDVHWGKESAWIEFLSKLNGHKILIKGNHDLKQMSTKLRNMFDDVKDYKEIKDGGRTVIMSHYPILCYKHSHDLNTWMLHGHVHNSTSEAHFIHGCVKNLIGLHHSNPNFYVNKGHVINVGCMMPYMAYTPRTLDELIAAFAGGDIYA